MSERFEDRQVGIYNDLTQFAAIIQLNLATITCPTLILEGTADKDVTSNIGFWAGDTQMRPRNTPSPGCRKKCRHRPHLRKINDIIGGTPL